MDGAVQSAVWDRVLSLPVPFFRDYTAGDLANRINGINMIRHALSGTTVTTLLSSLFTLVSFILLFYYSVALAVVATLLTAVAIAVVVDHRAAQVALRAAARGSRGPSIRHGAPVPHRHRQTARRGGRELGLCQLGQGIHAIAQHRLQGAEHRRRRSHFFAGYTIIINAVIFAVIGMFIVEGSGTRMSTGDFVAFSAAFGAFFVALVTLSETMLRLLNLLPIYGRAKPILEELPEVDASKKHPGELHGSIEVVKLGFSYTADQEILKGREFQCASGRASSLWSVHRAPASPPSFGSCSASRSRAAARSTTTTRISLTSTCARCDGKLGVVLQGGQLMTGDIFSNIVGSSQLTIDDAWEAARMVGLEEDIDANADGHAYADQRGLEHAVGGTATAHPDCARHHPPASHSALR